MIDSSEFTFSLTIIICEIPYIQTFLEPSHWTAASERQHSTPEDCFTVAVIMAASAVLTE